MGGRPETADVGEIEEDITPSTGAMPEIRDDASQRKMRRKISKLNFITEQIVLYEIENDSGMGNAFENYEEALEWLYSSMDGEPEFQDDHSDHEEFFKLLKRTDLHKAESEEELWMLEARLEEYKTQGYDETELVARYRIKAEEKGEPLTSSDTREMDNIPTPSSYKNSFGEWNTALWHAGVPYNEKLGTELLLDELNDYIHKLNEDRDIDEYEIPTTTKLNEADHPPSAKALREDDEIGSYKTALEKLGFQHLREEPEMPERFEIKR